MLYYKDPAVSASLMQCEFGIEKESLRIMEDGSFSHTPHPFLNEKNIVRDFCENQLEVNTGVSDTEEGAIEELESYEKKVREVLRDLPEREYLWPFSNPPYIKDEDDIPVANFTGPLIDKSIYRDYLAKVYGKYKMTFSGIHVNFSISDELIGAHIKAGGGSVNADSLKNACNRLYLDLARNLVADGWILNVLISASPVLDGSFLEQGIRGKTDFLGMASVRESELGYWNNFVPVLDYGSVGSYAASIRSYIDKGLITSQTELYYPVRIKPAGSNTLENLICGGANHIELRNVDLNPYAYAGIDLRDLQFIRLLALYELCRGPEVMDQEQQIRSVINFKNAARYDIDANRIMVGNDDYVTIREASLSLIASIEDFFNGIAGTIDPSYAVKIPGIISYQKDKLTGIGGRYAERVMKDFGNDFFREGLKAVIS